MINIDMPSDYGIVMVTNVLQDPNCARYNIRNGDLFLTSTYSNEVIVLVDVGEGINGAFYSSAFTFIQKTI